METNGHQEIMTSINNQSPCRATPAIQSPEMETHAAILMPHQPENGSRDPAAIVPFLADMNHIIDADLDDDNDNWDGIDTDLDDNNDQDGIDNKKCGRYSLM